MYSVQLVFSSGRTVTLARYTDAEHARRDCVLNRVSFPRATRVEACGPNGNRLMSLGRRS